MKNKILIVDDDTTIQDLLTEAFNGIDYETFCASNAEDALIIAEKEKILGFILDIKLPGMSGVDLFTELKRHSPVGFYFAMTGYASVADLLLCREAGFDDYFAKPFKIDDILRAAKEGFRRVQRWQNDLEVLPYEYR